MNLKRTMLLFATMLILAACTNNTQKDPTFEPTGNKDLELIKLSSKGAIGQNPSNRAKELLSNYEEVSAVRAVNVNDELLIAIDVDHHERFSLDNIKSELQKKTRREFSNMKVTLSTDQKILLELKRLEGNVQNKNISKEELYKKVTELKKLSKEET